MSTAASPPSTRSTAAGPIADRLRRNLTEGLAPERLDIIDESHRHAGHAGHQGGAAADGAGETHFQAVIVAAAFEGVPRVERQRLVYRLVAAEMAERVHALALTTLTPAEAAARAAAADRAGGQQTSI